MNIPDLISPIIAYRTWQWDAQGMLSLNNVRWTPGEALQARCERGIRVAGTFLGAMDGDYLMITGHDAPADNCTCGVYAAKNLKHLHNIGYIGHGQIHGECYLWGKVWDHNLGYRAEYAYPKNMVICVRSVPFQIADALKHLEPLMLYNVDISLTAEEYEGAKQTEYLLYRKDAGLQQEGLDFIVESRQKWYTGVKGSIAPLAVGDRVSILSKGLGIVHGIEDTKVHVLMYNKMLHTIPARDIKWSRQNHRWETETVGYQRFMSKQGTPVNFPRVWPSKRP